MSEAKEKEFFLREKMYDLHLFTVKLLITFSSSTIVFSIGMLNLFEKDESAKVAWSISIGWVCILLSIGLIVTALFRGLELTYSYYNNIQQNLPEIDEKTHEKEEGIQKLIYYSAALSGAGVIFILIFVYVNFL